MAARGEALETCESEDGGARRKGGMDPPAKAKVQRAVPISVWPASAYAGQEAAGHSQGFGRAGGQRRNQAEPSSRAGT